MDIANDSPRDFLVAPSLIVEVISERSEIIDRRERMRAIYEDVALLDAEFVE